jgi:hypothetical protein
LGIDRDSRPEAEDAAQPIVPVYDPAIREHLEHADREGFRQPEIGRNDVLDPKAMVDAHRSSNPTGGA